MLDAIMFADDTKLFSTHKDRHLFQIVDEELAKINNQSFFHKPNQKENISLLLPKLIINNYEIQRIIRIIHCKQIFAHARYLPRESNILNVVELNISNNLVFMY